MRIGFIISLVFAIIVAVFSIQNVAVTPINLLSARINISLALIIIISLIIGAVIVTLLGLKKEFTLSRGNKRLTKKAEDFKDDIEFYKRDNSALKTENETFKRKIEASETVKETMKNEINELKDELKHLNTTSMSEDTPLM